MQIKLELTFPGELKEEPIICYLCKQFDLTLNIVEASFSTDTGWAILVFDGKEEELKRAFTYLKSKGIEFQEIQNLA
ncbi:MAG: NIL domain-containing protein [Candidatus Omnitrophica bacterium]|nr:NIL domain-containing protein [Candidatus Omnitrophota bacterium]